jgi:hypothetical protein
MENAVIVRGKMGDSRHIELDEPVPGLLGDVEVVLRPLANAPDATAPDVFDVIASLSPGTRSKEDIDQQLAEERASWGER